MAFCILGAMVGAGFASGREIMQYFSQWGHWSWGFVALAWAVMSALCCLASKGTGCKSGWLLLPLYIAVGGGMTAAAGELAALTLPVFHARTFGGLYTLLLCAFFSRRSLGAMAWVSRALLPLMLAAFLLCARIQGEGGAAPIFSWEELALALLRLMGYCGMNVMLALPVIREIKDRKRTLGLFCLLLLGLLAAGNAVLLPHGEAMKNAPLPVVELLRAYGKPGYYLSAAVLYLAVCTTLLSVLRGAREQLSETLRHPMAASCLTCGVAAVVGFERIVAWAYPVFGYLAMGMLLWEGMKAKHTRQRQA